MGLRVKKAWFLKLTLNKTIPQIKYKNSKEIVSIALMRKYSQEDRLDEKWSSHWPVVPELTYTLELLAMFSKY